MTSDPTHACPSSETLGAFAEGRLGAEERDAVIAHLDSCARCREEVALLADFVDAGAAAAPARRWSSWWAAAAAAIVVVTAAIVLWRSVPQRDARPIAPLVAASADLDHRRIEPRIHGFDWAEYRGAVRANEDDRSPERLKLLGAAGDVLQRAKEDHDADAQHAAGVASLLIADPAAAIARLRAVAERSQDASAWSDLAAAHYDLAVRLGRDSQYADALSAADRALKIDARLPEALFNRALILERLGLIDDARAAWKRYLEVDSNSRWAAEARRRLEALPVAANLSSAFQKALETDEAANLVARFPQQARAFAEVELLARWAEHQDDASLAKARAIGIALQKRSGESLLADAVRAIDEGDAATRERLAEAHLAYRSGRLALHRHDVASARSALIRAASLFGETPAAWNARYFAAVAEQDAGHTSTADEELTALANDLRDQRQFLALRAQTAWQRGLVHATQARWPDALARYHEARALFADLGEASNAAFLDLLIGEAATMLGRRDEAWGGWTRAFRALSEHGFNDRLLVTLGMISNTESIAGRNVTASSILDLEIAHASKDDRVRADALFRRAILSARMQDADAARRAVEEGTRIASRIDDADVRANLRLAEGIVFGALPSLNAAIEHYRVARPLLLPVALRERGRVLRASGKIDEATNDLRAAVDAIELHRGEVEWREVRAAAVDGVEGIYLALTEVLLERGLTADAFAVADRAAAHAFYGAAATRSIETIETLQRNLGKGAVIEYVTLPRELAIFTITADRIAVKRVAVDDLPRRVAALNDAIRNRGDVRAASLYPLLIAPVRDAIANAETITFVPDTTLESVPFGALFDPYAHRWLIEEHAIRRAPTALGIASEPPSRDAQLVVIRPAAVDLPGAASEAQAIARQYRRSTVIGGESPAAVVAAMQDADIIHYAGHTDSRAETGLALGESVLYGTDIARLQLRTPLVVLAGCRTMRGAAHREDVATSLARAFLLAGARAVVGTAWDLDDRTGAALFARLHAGIASDADPAAALRDAQLSVLSRSASEPADWAAAEIIVRSAMTSRRTS